MPVLHLSLSHLETAKIAHIWFVVAIGVRVRAPLVCARATLSVSIWPPSDPSVLIDRHSNTV